MSATSYGWLVLAFPLAGNAGHRARLEGAAGPRCRAGSRSGAILGSFLASIGALFDLLDRPRRTRQLVD